jgi:NAD(P)-dependent dehydrogenase (short-subunit alcohol dehydrogenase family)
LIADFFTPFKASDEIGNVRAVRECPVSSAIESVRGKFERVCSVNVKAPYFRVAELAPLMATRGKGAIVNISTMAADLRRAWHESLWLEQGGDQLADEGVGCKIRPERRPC